MNQAIPVFGMVALVLAAVWLALKFDDPDKLDEKEWRE